MSKTKNIVQWMIFILLPIVFILVSLCVGAYKVSIPDVFKILTSIITSKTDGLEDMAISIVIDTRLPRILGAAMAGAGLSVSGAVFQSLFGNPLADPYTLGVSNGAGFGAAIAIVLSLSTVGVQITAMIFGMGAVGLTFLLSAKDVRSTITIILSGMLVSALFSSLISLIKFTADPFEKLPQIIYWLMGTLVGVNYKGLLSILPAYLLSMLVLFLYRWRINVLSMGSTQAKSFGIDTRNDRMAVIFASTLLTSLVVSISGIIGWVGIVIPHLARMIVGPDFRRLMPACVSLGICYLILIDDLCRTLTSLEIPIGVITGIIGIPIFVYFIYTKKVNW
ncbi:MAG: FecCD family ABC transporter permease [Anaerovoracaceae bacterium]